MKLDANRLAHASAELRANRRALGLLGNQRESTTLCRITREAPAVLRELASLSALAGLRFLIARMALNIAASVLQQLEPVACRAAAEVQGPPKGIGTPPFTPAS